MKKLSEKQQKFCRNIAILGMSQIDAYVDAYNVKSVTKAMHTNAYKLGTRNTQIVQRVQELREKIVEQPLIASKSERMQLLTEIMRKPEERSRDRLHSIEILSRIDGDFVTKSVTENNINVSLKQYSNDDLVAMLQAARQQGEIVEGERVE